MTGDHLSSPGLTLRAALLNPAVIVSALGYFVDIYDLVLFSVIRVTSLKSFGISGPQLLDEGVKLLNLQMSGMLLGGILWGLLGDRRGRVSVLFGSILLYSCANIANAFAPNLQVYGALRFLAGVGLAGELGAAVTLVSETLPTKWRGLGTSLVAAVGVSGAIVAAAVAKSLSWQAAFLVGGGMGLSLLVLRVRLRESGLFAAAKDQRHRRGDLRLLFATRERVMRYIRCILVGMPLWFVVGILITFSPELCSELGATGPVDAGTGILVTYAGLSVGDLATGIISQRFKNRKKVVGWAAFGTMALSLIFVVSYGQSPFYYYCLAFFLGCFAGYWALFATVAAEQFGTNLRATVAITVPNMVRGSVVPLTLALGYLKVRYGLAAGTMIVGAVCYLLTFWALYGLAESFHRDLDFFEEG